jgi:hypothetical protein
MPQILQVLRHLRIHIKRGGRLIISIDELIQNKMCLQTVVIPRGNDRSASHVIVVVDDIIFNSTQLHAMELCRESLDWICGARDMDDINMAITFKRSVKTNRGMQGQ